MIDAEIKGIGMDEDRKSAYRYLIYWALLEIRSLPWRPLGIRRLLSPWEWSKGAHRIHRAGEIADWLHNLALFSSLDFEGFVEERFWRELDRLKTKHPHYALAHYREVFESRLAELRRKRTM